MGNSISSGLEYLTGGIVASSVEAEFYYSCKFGVTKHLRDVLYDPTKVELRQRCLAYREAKYGRNCLMIAAQKHQDACLQMLLDSGMDVNLRDTAHGRTALHYASLYGNASSVAILARSSSCNVLMSDLYHGKTALDLARDQYHVNKNPEAIECIKILEELMLVYQGWMYYSADNMVSKLMIGASSMKSWKHCFCLVMRTSQSNYLELAIFKMYSGDVRPVLPTAIFWYEMDQPVTTQRSSKWLDSKRFVFTITGSQKGQAYAPYLDTISPTGHMHEFAAIDENGLRGWLGFFENANVFNGPQIYHTQNLPPAPVVATAPEPVQEEEDIQYAMAASAPASAPDAPRISTRTQEEDDFAYAMELSRSLNGTMHVAAMTVEKESSMDVKDSSVDAKGSGEECAICFDAPVQAACVPCGHTMACYDCLQGIKESSQPCPVCRITIQQVIRLYKS